MEELVVVARNVEDLDRERVYPLGAEILAEELRGAGCSVTALDLNLTADPDATLVRTVEAGAYDRVWLSLRNIDPLGNRTASFVPGFAVTTRIVRRLLPAAKIIVGGTAFALFADALMDRVPEIDFGIRGEIERSLPAVLPRIAGTPGRDVLSTEPHTPLVTAPRRDIFPLSAYLALNTYVPPVGIEAARGCPLHCAYCAYPRIQGRRVRLREPGAVVDEMERLGRDARVTRFHFTDPVVNLPRRKLDAICEEILRRGLRDIRWDGFFREDALDRDAVALYRRAGCECFSFSPDGLSEHALSVLQKDLTLDQVFRAAALTAETDVITVYHFMVNVPGETAATAKESRRTITRLYEIHGRKRNLGTVILNNIRILPGTAMEDLARKEGVIGPGDALLYPTYYNPPPFNTLRYELEEDHRTLNAFFRHGIKE